MDIEWLIFEDNIDLFEVEAKRNCQCLFDNGDICNYNDEHPFAVMTHFKLSEITKLKAELLEINQQLKKALQITNNPLKQ